MKKNLFTRILTVVLVVVMVMSMAACGGKATTDAPAQNAGTATETKAPAKEDGAKETEAPAATVERPTSLDQIAINVAGTDATGNYDGAVEPEGIVPGTSFTFWTNYDVPIYTPWMDNRAAAIAYQIYDNLLVKFKGNVNDIRPNIAESYTVDDTGLIWTFKLREDVTFSCGHKLTSADFIATWDVMQTYQPRPFSSVEKYEATGDYEIVVTLKAPNPTFIYELPTQNIYGVVCHEELAEFGPEDNRSANGCGPFVCESYESGTKYVLKAREDYWNKDRMPHVETAEIVVIQEENTALLGLMSGDIDCLNTVNIEVMKNALESGFTVALIEDRENPFWLNCKQVDVLKDIRVREALCHMVDWEALSQLVYDGLYPHPNSYFTGTHVAEFSDKYTYDPELGLKLLEEAGVKPEDVKFTLLADPDFTDLEVAMVAQFTELGLTGITTETLDGGTCYGMLKSGTFDAFPVHNGYDPVSPLTPFTMGLLEGGTQPCMFLKAVNEEAYNEAVEYYNAAATSSNTEDFYANVVKMMDIVQENCLALGGLQVIRGYVFAENVRGAYVAPVSSELQFCHVWIAE